MYELGRYNYNLPPPPAVRVISISVGPNALPKIRQNLVYDEELLPLVAAGLVGLLQLTLRLGQVAPVNKRGHYSLNGDHCVWCSPIGGK